MVTTTSYGTWLNRVDHYSTTVEQTVLNGGVEDAVDDPDTVVAEYVAAINAALPPGVGLHGSEFVGPYYDDDRDFDGYPIDEDGALDIKAIVESIDLATIIERHLKDD